MKAKLTLVTIGRAALWLLLSTLSTWAQGTAITFQGRLNSNGAPFTGDAEFQPTLWDSADGGAQVAANNPMSVSVSMSNGLFVLPLDFGANFPGADRWLQLDVRTSGGPFTILAPRQRLTSTPYAISASNLTGILPAAQLSGALPSANLAGTYSGAVTFNNSANSFVGDGSGLTSLNASNLVSGMVPPAVLGNAWKISGNSGTSPTNDNFIGTTDNEPLELRVNGQRALRLEPNAYGAPSMVGGSPVNFIAPGINGAVIAGGGIADYVGVAYPNSVYDNFETIGGGLANTIQTSAGASTIAGGQSNTIQTNAQYSTIGGGLANTIQTNAYDSTIGGGFANTIQANAQYSTIGGGDHNTIQTNAYDSAIGGGFANTIQTNAYDSAIGGGFANTIQANAQYSTIGGGDHNTIQTNAGYATIPGGSFNTAAGSSSFAVGLGAQAFHDGSFVWSDYGTSFFASTTTNQFSVRARGGARFVTGSAGLKLGPTGQYFAPGGLENLRVVRGVIGSAGNTLYGTGFTVTRTGTGAYTIMFSSAFADFPTVTVSVQSGLPRMATTTNVNNGSAQVRTFDGTAGATSGTAVDAQFHFIAVGPQ